MRVCAAPLGSTSRCARAHQPVRPRLLLGGLFLGLLACCNPSTSTGQEVYEQKTASRLYFETFGSIISGPADEPTFPRTCDLGHGRTMRLRGRLDTDFIWSTQSESSQLIIGNLGSVVGIRRGRIGIEGDLQNDARYIGEIDMAGGLVVPQDVFLGFGEANQGGERRYGHYREPFSLEGYTSANYFAFMERSPINTLDPARAWGIGLFRCNPSETTTFAIAVFHAGSDPADLEAGEGATAALTLRLTAAPLLEGDGERLLHLGTALSQRLPVNDVVIVNPTPADQLLDLANSSESPFVPELRIPADYQQLFNLQFACVDGPLWVQSEWYSTLIPRSDGGGLVFIHGYYAACGYFVTGEHRAYLSQRGTFGPVRVARPFICGPAVRGRPLGFGAWELTARFSYEDYTDPDLPVGPTGLFQGIRLPQGTFGVNWYWTDRMRILFNYTYVVPDELQFGKSEASLFAMRLNVYW